MSLIDLDHTIFYFVNQLPHNIYLDFIFIAIDLATRQGIIFIIIAFMFYLTKDLTRRNRPFTFLVLISMFFTYLTNTLILKNIFLRERPVEALENVILIGLNPSTYSFPSGHTAIAFSFFTSCLIIFKRKPITVISFFFALLVGFDRIYMGHHFPIDVLAGAIIGTIVTMVIAKSIDYLRAQKKLNIKEIK